MSAGHAPFAPSAAKRWMTCTASVPLGLLIPEPPSSEYADAGTRLHDVAAAALKATHGTTVMTKDDAQALKPYLDYAHKRIKAANVFRIEERLEHSQLLFGTPDLLALFNDTKGPNGMAEVVDLKNGQGIMVAVEENEQLLTYAYMALAKLGGPGGPGVPKNVRLTIVQPPDEANPVKSWDTTSERVLAHGEAAEAAIQTAIEGRGEFVPGDHCRFCKAKPICPALRGEVIEALASAMPATMTPASMAQWLDRAERMEGFIKDLREVAHAVASVAHSQQRPGIPGWVLKPKRATRQWADEEAVLKIARQRKIKIFQDKLLSPAMAEKEHPNLPEELRKQIIAVSSGSNLVRGEDRTVYEATPALSLADKVNLLKLRS